MTRLVRNGHPPGEAEDRASVMRAISTAELAQYLMSGMPVPEPLRVPSPSFPAGRAAAWLLPTDPAGVSAIRERCRAVLHGWELDSAIDPACLVVTELVTNAVEHGRAP